MIKLVWVARVSRDTLVHFELYLWVGVWVGLMNKAVWEFLVLVHRTCPRRVFWVWGLGEFWAGRVDVYIHVPLLPVSPTYRLFLAILLSPAIVLNQLYYMPCLGGVP